MSTRRQAGDIVFKKAGAGFVGWGGLVVIGEGEPEVVCLMECGDVACQEWPNLYEVDSGGTRLGGVAYHVNECEMGDP